MAGFSFTPATGVLTINSVSMNTPAWAMVDVSPLWTPSGARGENVVIPGVDGTLPTYRRNAEARHSLPMGINGEANQSGTPFGDVFVGLQTNIAYLRANVVTTGSGFVTYTASLVLPNGNTVTADVQVTDIVLGEHFLDLMRATLEMTIPAGVFA